MASFLPVPTIRAFWSARGGGLFFVKWMVFCAAQMILLFLPFKMLSGTNWDSGLNPNVYWIVPPFLSGLALFGLHWRTLAWGTITIGASYVSSSLWPDMSHLHFELPHKVLVFMLLPV
jgi:hypothetical protein